MVKVLQKYEIIVWDERTMMHKKSLEALNHTLRDLRTNNNRFGSTLFLLSIILLDGHFRQILPVIP